MALVLDASMTVAWCYRDEATAYTESMLDLVRDEGALVPEIWPLEIANSLLIGERRGRLTLAESARFVALLQTLPITVDSLRLPAGWGTILDFGRNYRLSAYDASYLALAVREGLPLASQDARMRDAATRVGIALAESSGPDGGA